jgi:hypothetical protein
MKFNKVLSEAQILNEVRISVLVKHWPSLVKRYKMAMAEIKAAGGNKEKIEAAYKQLDYINQMVGGDIRDESGSPFSSVDEMRKKLGGNIKQQYGQVSEDDKNLGSFIFNSNMIRARMKYGNSGIQLSKASRPIYNQMFNVATAA